MTGAEQTRALIDSLTDFVGEVDDHSDDEEVVVPLGAVRAAVTELAAAEAALRRAEAQMERHERGWREEEKRSWAAEAALRETREQANAYRIEADHAMRDYEALVGVAFLALSHLSVVNRVPRVREAQELLDEALTGDGPKAVLERAGDGADGRGRRGGRVSAELFDDPRFTIGALIEVQDAIVRFNERYEVWRDGLASSWPDEHLRRIAREWDGLDLPSVVPVLREARHMIDLLTGYDEDLP